MVMLNYLHRQNSVPGALMQRTRLTSGGKAYLKYQLVIGFSESSRVTTYHDQKAIMKPNHEKKNTRPYTLIGFKPGMDRALRLTGLTTGACHRTAGLNMLILNVLFCGQKLELKRTGFEDALHRIYEILIDCYPPSAMQIDPLRSKRALLFQTFSRSSK